MIQVTKYRASRSSLNLRNQNPVSSSTFLPSFYHLSISAPIDIINSEK